jgi:flagellar hook-length control protein FliK
MQNLPISPSASPVAPSQVASSQADAGAQDGLNPTSPGSDFNAVLTRQMAAEASATARESNGATVGVGVISPVVLAVTNKVADKHGTAPAVDGVTTAAQNGMMALMGVPMMSAELQSGANPAPISAPAPEGLSSAGAQYQQSLLEQLQAGEASGLTGKLAVGSSATATESASSATATQDMAFSAAMQAAANMQATVSEAGQKQAAALSDPARDARLLVQSQTQSQGLMAASQMAAPNASQDLMVNTPVGNNRWNEDLGQKITWMAGHGSQSAELQLNPPDLGPLHVVLNVSGDQATALFTSPHAAVREAVQQALPKLRDMLADNGIMLGNASVSDQGRQGAQSGYSGEGSKPSSSSGRGAVEVSSVQQGPRSISMLQTQGLVDTFA